MDALAEGKAERYAYFEGLNVIEFLNLLQFQCDKAEERKREIELERLKSKRG